MDALPTQSLSNDRPSLSLVLPAFNEAPIIAQAIAEADQALSSLTDDYEILVVDDGSQDDTSAIVNQQTTIHPRVRLLKQRTNQGYGAALARGFREATKDLVAFSDADCQFDLRELARLIDLSAHYDIVCGYRIDRQDPLIRKVYSGGYNLIVRLLLGTRVRDSDCALKLFHREVIQSIDITTTGFFVNSEILTKARLAKRSIVEVGVTHRPRPRGESTVSITHIPPVLKSILRFWWNTIQFPPSAGEHPNAPAAAVRWRPATEFLAMLVLLLACLVAMLPNLGFPLIDPDETRYTQIALEMLETGDWITPRLDNQPYLDKPPLLYWLTATSASLFGVNEFAVRLPPLLSAIGTILLTFLLGKRLVGSRAAFCGAIALLLCGGFVIAGRFLIMDSLLTFFTTATLITGYLATTRGTQRPWWWLASSVACALGVLTKGPLAIVLCVPPLIAIGWLGQNPSRPKVREWLAFGLPVALICIPWYVAVWVANPSFGDYFFWQHNVARFTSGANHQQPWWFYAPILLAGMFPTSLLLPTLIAFLLGRSESKRRLRSADLGFLFCSSLWIIGFFSIASCKLATYILPAMPLICLMLGNMLDLTVFRPELAHRITLYLRPFPRRASMIVLASCGLVAIVDLVLNPEFRLLPALAIGSCAVLAMLIVRLWHHPLMPSGWGWGVTAALGIATVGFTSSQLLGTIAETRSTHSHSARLLRQDPDRAVVYFRESAHAASLYFPKQKVQRFDHTQLADFAAYLDQHPRAIVITSGTGIELTKNAVAAHLDLVPVDARARVYLTNPVKSRARIADRSDLDRHK